MLYCYGVVVNRLDRLDRIVMDELVADWENLFSDPEVAFRWKDRLLDEGMLLEYEVGMRMLYGCPLVSFI